jgi:predicted dehydrogenase
MFGPVREVSAFAARVVDDEEDVGGNGDAAARHGDAAARGPDFGVACLRFDGGVVARLTCSTLAPRDRSLRVFGDEGVIRTRDCSDDRSPVYLRRYWRVRRRLMLSPLPRRYRLLDSGTGRVRYRGSQRRDFARGIAELAAAVREGRAPVLSPAFCLHATEVILAIDAAAGGRPAPAIRTTFEPLQPMAWARG